VGAGAAVGTARVFSLVCTAIQLPLLTNFLSPSEYSQVALAIAISTYFTLVTAEPVTLAFQRFPGDRSDRGTYRYALTRSTFALILVGATTVGVALIFGQWKEALAVVGWGIGLAVVRLVSTAWLMWADPWRYAANLMLSTGVRTVGLVGLVIAGADASLAIAVAGLASAVATLIVSPRIRSVIPIRKPPWTWQFGVHLAAASLAVTILTSVGLVLLPFFVSRTEVGRFAAMTQLATLTCGAVLGLVSTVAYPALRRLWDEGHIQMTSARLAWLSELCLATALLAIAAFSAGEYWLPGVVVGRAYLDTAILPALVLSSALATMGQLSGWYHQFQFHAARVSRRTWGSAIVGVIATAAGAAIFGTAGAAVGGMLGFLVYYLALRWRTNLGPLLGVAAALLAASCVVVAFRPGPGVTAAVCIASALIGIAMGAHLVWRLRAQRN
jgi:O-antigen/teichoic acid export membrane protein